MRNEEDSSIKMFLIDNPVPVLGCSKRMTNRDRKLSIMAATGTPGDEMRKQLLGMVMLATSVAANAGSTGSLYSFHMKTIDGAPTTLAPYKGKVLLLVNVASACGFTPQYAALESVYEKYKDKGLVIVGIPANNFANQESGTDAEIKTFCNRKYHVSFPMMSKISVKGADQTPLYGYLTSATTDPKFAGDIKWNFTKFLVGRNGQPVARFEPATTPDSPQVIAAIESELSKK
ncbi:glutathione peroxidase [Terriglobus roseus]|uniref:Glutathione peroxidase n=2 Tax=Terriglobus roseus TaxID=392734 RepID=A0A1G7F9Z8_9BACT|nr:glutathione peroxidase [Terriglobus roseus]